MPTFLDVLIVLTDFVSDYMVFVAAAALVGVISFGARRIIHIGTVSDAGDPRQADYDEAARHGISKEEVDANYRDAYMNYR